MNECCTKYADHVFVFGANEAGRHGAGAAKHARSRHGAVYGHSAGLQGTSYALPTKNEFLTTLPLTQVAEYVAEFVAFATAHPDMRFYVTKVGCGLAGYREEEIAPLFAEAPANCVLPEGWR